MGNSEFHHRILVLFAHPAFHKSRVNRTLVEHCDGLLESIFRARGVDTYLPPSNAKEVTEKFVAFLEAEEVVRHRPVGQNAASVKDYNPITDQLDLAH